MMNFKITEIFYTLQGEGVNAGVPAVFIRFSGCKAWAACYAKGIKCDTEWESFSEMSKEDICSAVADVVPFPVNERHEYMPIIVLSGGEPLQQLNSDEGKELLQDLYYEMGFSLALETSGLFPVENREMYDHVTVSPKVAEHVLKKNFPDGVDELRYVIHAGQPVPNPQIEARHHYISPHSDGDRINVENLHYCIELCKSNPKWTLSMQQHKIWGVR